MFTFNHTNYGRWVPVYFEDALHLANKFPELHSSFHEDGGFVVYRSKTTNSAVPMDQGLEQAYNKTAKSAGGIIGFTQKKEAVALWNIIHPEKEGHRHFLENRIEHENSEFSLHHEFSESSAQKSMSKYYSCKLHQKNW